MVLKKRRHIYNNVFDQRQGFHSREQHTRGYQNLKEATSTFLFTNFPENFGTKEMRSVFNRYGKVGDVYISARKNKQGNDFGFVRFLYVPNIKYLEGQLATILIGNQKLWVNIPKYNRGIQKRVDVGAKSINTVVRPHGFRRGVSYAKVVQ